MHALEKILARASGEKAVEAGQFVTARVDLREVNNDLLPTDACFF